MSPIQAAAWLASQSFCGASLAAPVTPTQARRCPDCGWADTGSHDVWEAGRFVARANCCSAERNELGLSVRGGK